MPDSLRCPNGRAGYVVTSRLFARKEPSTEATRPYINDGHAAYHEAGHAVAFWHHGVKLRYVTMRPPPDSGHGAQTVTVDRETSDPAELENEMRCAVAGEIAVMRVFRKPPPTDDQLIAAFRQHFVAAAQDPDHATEDPLIFADLGHRRDEEMCRQGAPDAAVGPESWIRIWREAWQLICVDLWPAVQAVAEELRKTERDLLDGDVAALAAAAMTEGLDRSP